MSDMNNIGTSHETINPIANLFSAITNSGLSESQQYYLGLKMLKILNSEIKGCNATLLNINTWLSKYGSEIHTSTETRLLKEKLLVMEYRKEIEIIQKLFCDYFKKVFQDLYISEKISPLEYTDALDHYCNQKSLNDLKNDRSGFCKKIRKVLRGFSGSVRGSNEWK